MFDEKEMAAWESEQSYSRDHVKIHKNPKRAKLRDFRKGIKGVHYNKEVKEIRKSDYRKYRTQIEASITNYYVVINEPADGLHGNSINSGH